MKVIKAARLDEIERRKGMVSEKIMTNEQFETILKMIRMILDGCEDVETAKAKVDELIRDTKEKKKDN